MTVLLIILGMVSVVMLFLLFLQRCEIKSISEQIDRILSQDSNELIHSENGGIYSNLINKINQLLKKLRQNQILYKKKNHELEQMITNISHDLRTPLTSAMGYINIILNSDLSDDEKEREIRIIEQRLSRLEELINSFFEFSKMVSNNFKPETERINLVEILQESIVHYYDDFCGQEREIILICDTSKIMIQSNKDMLMRIFDNLIGNAFKHGIGNLNVKILRTGNISVCFQNELNDSYLDISRIFDEFYTTDISRIKGNTGLGLAIAKQFSEILGGSISAEYNGNIFSITVKCSL